jgi:hypothetical protein
MLGVNLLVRLGRRFLAGPVAAAGLLPAGYYRHLVLAALEEEDFPVALRHLRWTEEPLLAQILVFRLRLLAAAHRRQCQALQELGQSSLSAPKRDKCQALLRQEEQALGLLGGYEARAMEILAGSLKQSS